MKAGAATNFVAIACGGTGGHLFPGIAVGEKLLDRGCEVALLVSEKEVDQIGAQSASGMDVVRLPAAPLLKGTFPQFFRGSWRSFWTVRNYFKKRRPAAVLAMGGFTSAAPILAGKLAGARTAIHESNSYAGKANRLLDPWVDHVFIGFSSAANQLRNRSVQFTGTPVRTQFQAADAAACRMALGLSPEGPVVLVTGGSQGAGAINKAILEAVPVLARKVPDVQFLHLTGAASHESISAGYKSLTSRAKALPFLTEMELALGAATVAVSRAGASTLAELAAMEVPSILIPYPHSADDHQYHNARAFAQAGASRMMVQSQLKPELLGQALYEIISDPYTQQQMKAELRKWHYPEAAEQIAAVIVPETPSTQPVRSGSGVLSLHLG